MQCKKCGAELPYNAYGDIKCQFCNTQNYVPIPEKETPRKGFPKIAFVVVILLIAGLAAYYTLGLNMEGSYKTNVNLANQSVVGLHTELSINSTPTPTTSTPPTTAPPTTTPTPTTTVPSTTTPAPPPTTPVTGSNIPPIASFSVLKVSGSTYFVGYQFNASMSRDSDGKIISYMWDFGDTERDYGELIRHKYYKIGTYKVILTVQDDAGDIDTDTFNLVVKEEEIIEPVFS